MTQGSFTNKRFTNKLGDLENWRNINSATEKDAHEQSGTFAIKTSAENLFENSRNKIIQIQIDNIRALTSLQMVCFSKLI